MRFSVSGQTCGQTENLRTFKTSGEPKKSMFSRGFSVFQNFGFEIGGLHPKLARYQLRYTSKCSVFLAFYIIEMSFRAPCRAAYPTRDIQFYDLADAEMRFRCNYQALTIQIA